MVLWNLVNEYNLLGAPSLYALALCEMLIEQFPGTWIAHEAQWNDPHFYQT